MVPSVGRLIRFAVSTLLAALLVASLSASRSPAASLSRPFKPHRQDSVPRVWVNTSSGVYHCPDSRYYGATTRGIYLSEELAQGRGYRPAYGKTCGAHVATADSASQPRPKAALVAPAPGTRVWVNLSSGVYHCPGTRYYGTTRNGGYMSEPEARRAGHRPAYGRACS